MQYKKKIYLVRPNRIPVPIEQIDKEKKKVFLIGHKQNDSRLSMTNSIRELQLHSDSPLVPVKG